MLYLTYEDYHNTFGGLLTEQQYAVFGARASAIIDRLTMGRAEPALEAHPDLIGPLEAACFQIADTLHSKYQALQRAARGMAGAATTDGYSEQYTDAQTASRAAENACYSILQDALGADVYGLLYQGVGCEAERVQWTI